MLRRLLVAIVFMLSLLPITRAASADNDALQPTPIATYDHHEVCYQDLLAGVSGSSVVAPTTGVRVVGRNHTQNFSPRSYHATDTDREVLSEMQLQVYTQHKRLPTRVVDYYLFFLTRLRL